MIGVIVPTVRTPRPRRTDFVFIYNYGNNKPVVNQGDKKYCKRRKSYCKEGEVIVTERRVVIMTSDHLYAFLQAYS